MKRNKKPIDYARNEDRGFHSQAAALAKYKADGGGDSSSKKKKKKGVTPNKSPNRLGGKFTPNKVAKKRASVKNPEQPANKPKRPAPKSSTGGPARVKRKPLYNGTPGTAGSATQETHMEPSGKRASPAANAKRKPMPKRTSKAGSAGSSSQETYLAPGKPKAPPSRGPSKRSSAKPKPKAPPSRGPSKRSSAKPAESSKKKTRKGPPSRGGIRRGNRLSINPYTDPEAVFEASRKRRERGR